MIFLKKLYSEPEIFDPITFHEGINLIMGEKSEEASKKGKKTNGVGKSISVEFINFCLLKKESESRVTKIPNDVLSPETQICLDLKIGKQDITIIRSKGKSDHPKIICNDETYEFFNIDDALKFLNNLLSHHEITELSMRELLSCLIRDERSEFKDIIQCHDTSKRNIPRNYSPYLYFLGISVGLYKEAQKVTRQLETIRVVVKDIKVKLTNNGTKKISLVRAELNDLEAELSKIRDAVATLDSSYIYNDLYEEIAALQSELDKFQARQKALRYEIRKIRDIPEREDISQKDVEMLYNQFKEGLGTFISKSIDQVKNFKNKIEEFQASILRDQLEQLIKELDTVTKRLKTLSLAHAQKMRILDSGGILKDMQVGLSVFHDKSIALSKTRSLLQEYEDGETLKKQTEDNKKVLLSEIEEQIKARHLIIKNFELTILQIHEFIMGTRKASFEIKVNYKPMLKNFLDFELRIDDDGSHSVERTKVFIYDIALMFNAYTGKNHPQFLIHDNIFDVDQDTLVQSLNFLAKTEQTHTGFQYILTLNRDKIENEERLDQIQLDIKDHTIAYFTKEKRFLKCSYQEI